MSTDTDPLERRLLEDLDGLGDRLGTDDRFAHDLYRALAGTALSHRDETGHVSLSWGRAAEIVNELRARHGRPPLEDIPQIGGEGEVSERAHDALDGLGWRIRAERHDQADPAHASNPASPPPRDAEPPEWRREGDAEAEASRLDRGN